MKSVISVKKKGTATAGKTIKNVSKPVNYTSSEGQMTLSSFGLLRFR